MSSPWQTPAYRLLATPVADVIGGQAAEALSAWNIATLRDLLTHLPRRYLSGTEYSDVTHLVDGEEVALMARVVDVSVHGYHPRMRLEATITDDVGKVKLTFFGRKHLIDWWKSQLEQGQRGIFVGKVTFFRQQPQLTHPDFVMLDEAGQVVGKADKSNMVQVVSTNGLIGLYPAKSSIPTWTVAECVRLGLSAVEGIPDPLPSWISDISEALPLAQAFVQAHRPQDRHDVDAARRRLVFDEAFSVALAMAKRRLDARSEPATPRVRAEGGLVDAFDAGLPYTLTQGQQEVGEQIFHDLAQTHPMQRLLQGEVGSGKTLVALRAMLAVVEAGGQAALLAPTEVLAGQHVHTLRRLMGDLAHGGLFGEGAGAQVTLLTGSMKAAAKRAAMLDIASGQAGIVVGTHALLSEQVQFADLGLVVVDEQHRFGVEQRATLAGKAKDRPHVLVMTATPIPRTIAMTLFGDLDTSTLTEIPAGRSTVSTTVVDTVHKPAWVERAWQRIAEEVEAGRQAFVVVPRIDGEGDGASVKSVYADLVAGHLSGVRVAMLHGKLPADEKDATMAAFAAGDIDVLVATTVVEVGVDVPNASVMVICDADKFGISQLHQLRGRIGRGEHPGVCLLLTSSEVGTPTRDRLDAVASTRDGFVLADVDLEQRREGDLLGLDQSGFPSKLRLLRVTQHAEVIEEAYQLALMALGKDPDLADPGLADAIAWVQTLAADEAWGG